MSKQPRYIFCINPGRSGSHYLAQLFDALPGVVGLHEPEPTCQREALAEWWQGNPEKMQLEWAQHRMVLLFKQKGHKTIAVTSNAFIKGFGWLIGNDIRESGMLVIDLRRNRADVIASLKRRNFLPRYETPATAWMSCPFRTGNPDLDLNAYLDWVDALGALWKSLHPNVRVESVNLEDLQDLDNVCAFMERCGLTIDEDAKEALAPVVGIPTNA